MSKLYKFVISYRAILRPLGYDLFYQAETISLWANSFVLLLDKNNFHCLNFLQVNMQSIVNNIQ